MAGKLNLDNEVHELKIGSSFTNPKEGTFHTIRYDFKPASVDINKMATVSVGKVNDVIVTVPHLDGAGVTQTVFKGPQKPAHKECVLIIDRVTGEFILEKITSTIQVKKTRQPNEQSRAQLQDRTSSSNDRAAARSATPPIGQRQSNKTRVTSGQRRPDRPITSLAPKHSPLHVSPNHTNGVNSTYKSPNRDFHSFNKNNDHHTSSPSASSTSHSNLPSLPLLGVDTFPEAPSVAAASSLPNLSASTTPAMNGHNGTTETLSASSSSSSSDNSSDDDDDDDRPMNKKPSNGHQNGGGTPLAISSSILNDDLQLSESDDSD